MKRNTLFIGFVGITIHFEHKTKIWLLSYLFTVLVLSIGVF